MTPFLKNLRTYLMILLVAAAPFHAFLITWIKSAMVLSDNVILVISAWREVILICIGILVVLELITKKTWPRLQKVDYLIVAFTLLALIWGIIQRHSITQWMLGFRFDVLPLCFYLIVKQVEWKKEWILKVLLGSALVVMVFGILHAVVLPRDFLMHFGYGQYQANAAPDTPLAACQYLEHTQEICRATSTFGGPTRYGTYLLLILGITMALAGISKERRIEDRKLRFLGGFLEGLLAALALINIGLTYSRSVWVGAAVILFGFTVWTFYKKGWLVWNKKVAAITVAIAMVFILAGAGGYRYLQLHKNGPETSQFFKSLFVRTNSTSEHVKFLEAGFARLEQNPMGIGLGTVGPASVRYEKFLTENWYLQIALEMGILGVFLFVAILILLMRNLWKRNSFATMGLLAGLIGVAVTGFFTHSFEETATALILFGTVGMFDSAQFRSTI